MALGSTSARQARQVRSVATEGGTSSRAARSEEYADLVERDELDLGYRLVIHDAASVRTSLSPT